MQLSDWVENIVEKGEIAIIMSNFSFSHSIFKNCQLLMRQNKYLKSKGLIFCKKSVSKRLYHIQSVIRIKWTCYYMTAFLKMSKLCGLGSMCRKLQVNPFPNTPFWDHPKFKEAADVN